MLMANQQSAELTEPGVGAFDDPATLVSTQLATILVLLHLVVVPLGHEQLDAALREPIAQRVGKDTCRKENAIPNRSGAAIKYLPDSPGWKPTDGLACPSAASAQAAAARSTSTAPRSTTRTASCSCKNINK